MLVTAGLGVNAGALVLRGIGGVSLGASAPTRRARRHRQWFDPVLGEAATRGWQDVRARRAVYLAQMAKAVAALERVGRDVAPLRQRSDVLFAPYMAPSAQRSPHAPRHAVLDYHGLLRNTAAIEELDELLEWADEEDVIALMFS